MPILPSKFTEQCHLDKIEETCHSTAMKLAPAEIAAFQKQIKDFYAAQGRMFAWRQTRDPYAILVSEIMLQQTQTGRVAEKYDEWLRRFPDAETLAKAPLADVLSAWNGLGYNRRAKYLQQACAAVCAQYGGTFPKDKERLDALPGVGPYTAGAVATFAYNSPEVFIETNIRSVFIYYFFTSRGVPAEQKTADDELLPLIAQTLDRDNPREWYYALMDYGAELKKSVKHITQQGKAYSKQSKFKGSFREARGAVLRQLTQHQKASVYQIMKEEGIDEERVVAAANKLMEENMIYRMDDYFYFVS